MKYNQQRNNRLTHRVSAAGGGTMETITGNSMSAEDQF